MAPSRHGSKIVDWDIKPQPKQTNKKSCDAHKLDFLTTKDFNRWLPLAGTDFGTTLEEKKTTTLISWEYGPSNLRLYLSHLQDFQGVANMTSSLA